MNRAWFDLAVLLALLALVWLGSIDAGNAALLLAAVVFAESRVTKRGRKS